MSKNDSSWKPGSSGNPRGSSSATRARVAAMRDLAGDEAEKTIAKLIELRDQGDDKTSFLACRELLDRGIGKTSSVLIDEELEARSELARAKAKELDLIAEVEQLRKQLEDLENSVGPRLRTV